MELSEKDKQLFLNTLNKKGFLLEDKAWKIFSTKVSNLVSIRRNYVISDGENRVEIDVLAKIKDKNFIVECKHTDYSWIFTKPPDRPETINLIYGHKTEGLIVKPRSTSDFITSTSHISILFNEEELVRKRGNLAQTSYRDVDEAVLQVLKETKTYFLERKGTTKYEFLIPMIVTNNPIYYLKYSEENLNERGDLEDYSSFEEIPAILYNCPQILGIERNKFSKYFGDGIIKSVFIVNVEHLEEIIPIIVDQQL